MKTGPFIISFCDGICRRMRAETLDEAIKEAMDAVMVTGRSKANILCAETYHVIGDVDLFRRTTGGHFYKPGSDPKEQL